MVIVGFTVKTLLSRGGPHEKQGLPTLYREPLFVLLVPERVVVLGLLFGLSLGCSSRGLLGLHASPRLCVLLRDLGRGLLRDLLGGRSLLDLVDTNVLDVLVLLVLVRALAGGRLQLKHALQADDLRAVGDLEVGHPPPRQSARRGAHAVPSPAGSAGPRPS